MLFARRDLFTQDFILHFRFQKKNEKTMMFVPSDGGSSSGMGGRRPGGPARPSGPPTKWDYVKTFYNDPFKWLDRFFCLLQ